MEHYKVVYGIKLYEKECTGCTCTFWLPKSIKQDYCSWVCMIGSKERLSRQQAKKNKIAILNGEAYDASETYNKTRRAKKAVNKITEDDYE